MKKNDMSLQQTLIRLGICPVCSVFKVHKKEVSLGVLITLCQSEDTDVSLQIL